MSATQFDDHGSRRDKKYAAWLVEIADALTSERSRADEALRELREIGVVCEGMGCGAYYGESGDGIKDVKDLVARMLEQGEHADRTWNALVKESERAYSAESRVTALEAEVERLRTALDEITEYPSYSPDPREAIHEAISRARAALTPSLDRPNG